MGQHRYIDIAAGIVAAHIAVVRIVAVGTVVGTAVIGNHQKISA